MQVLNDQLTDLLDPVWYPVRPPAVDVEALVRHLLQTAYINESEDLAKGTSLIFEVCVGEQMYRLRVTAIDHDVRRSRTVLSPREREIARLIAEGMGNKQIARSLGLSHSTVGTYTKRIYLKLNVNSRAGMVSKALEGGLLDKFDKA